MTEKTYDIQTALDLARADELGTFISVADDPQPAADGPLGGMPFAVKDNIDTTALPTTAGTRALADSRPGGDHAAVKRLLEAGAVLVGKTNMHELAFGITSNNGVYGPVRNPHDRARAAGGSSGGSATAVATGIVPFALGTDTGGSATIPAAWCGVVGFRPTTGRYGAGHVVPLSDTRDTVGIAADSVQRVIDIDAILHPESAAAAGQQLTLGLPSSGYLEDLAPDVAEVWSRAVDTLTAAGVTFVTVDTEGIHALEAACGFDVVFFEVVRDLSAYLRTLPGTPISLDEVIAQIGSPDVAGLMMEAVSNPRSEETYRAALQTRAQVAERYAAAFASAPIDALFYPTTPITATPIGDDLTTMVNGQELPVFPTVTRNTLPGSDVGLPVVTVPGGLGSAGLPVGLSLEGRPGEDRRVLETARRVAELLA